MKIWSENATVRIGSLFDGSGGFPLAATMCGIEPVWASEIEPYPIAVTRSRFPNMKHLGSVTDVKGNEVEPVDVITFGSPCQDLSVAGKRAGLKHTENGDEETTRSGLFMEAIRIIKEMREATNGKYPRFAVWENVPGAFSSNKGEDFRIVLEELIKVVEPVIEMPAVPGGKWPYEDCYVGDGWSIAYRTLDAQFWGVPQRRRRIYLVADFGSECAEEILFEQEGLRGHFAKGRTPWQAVAGDAESGVGAAGRAGECVIGVDLYNQALTGDVSKAMTSSACDADHVPCAMVPYTLKIRGGVDVDSAGKAAGKGALIQNNLSATPGVTQDQYLFQPMSVREENWEESCVRNALRAGESKSSHCVVQKLVYCLQGNGIDRADTADRPAVAYSIGNGQLNQISMSETCNTLDCMHDKQAVLVAGVDCRNMNKNPELYPTLQAKPNGGQSLSFSHAVRVRYIVRRLTPTECARLQGFPDEWGHPDIKTELTDEEYAFWLDVRNTNAAINGKATKDYTREQMLTWYNKLHTDSAEYKLWGNGIALPCALYVMQGIAEALKGGAGDAVT